MNSNDAHETDNYKAPQTPKQNDPRQPTLLLPKSALRNPHSSPARTPKRVTWDLEEQDTTPPRAGSHISGSVKVLSEQENTDTHSESPFSRSRKGKERAEAQRHQSTEKDKGVARDNRETTRQNLAEEHIAVRDFAFRHSERSEGSLTRKKMAAKQSRLPTFKGGRHKVPATSTTADDFVLGEARGAERFKFDKKAVIDGMQRCHDGIAESAATLDNLHAAIDKVRDDNGDPAQIARFCMEVLESVVTVAEKGLVREQEMLHQNQQLLALTEDLMGAIRTDAPE